VAISTIFPKQCNQWRIAVENARGYFHEETTKSQHNLSQELNDQEPSLRRALRDAVVDDVMKLFP